MIDPHAASQDETRGSASGGDARPRVQSAARVIDILQAVARSDTQGLTIRDISESLGVTRQVVYHLTHTLVAKNMLSKTASGTYILGLGVAALTHGHRRQMATTKTLGVLAERAAAATGETAYVVGWVDGQIVVLDSARGNAAIQVAEIPRGVSTDAHARASGKLLLAMSSDDDVRRYLETHPMTKRTPNTLTSAAAMMDHLGDIREAWVAIERGEYLTGISCMAVPIGQPPSPLVLGISSATQSFAENEMRYRKALQALAAEHR